MHNRRAYKRCGADGEGRITAEAGNIPFRLIDISASGALISLPGRLIIDGKHKLLLTFQIRIVHMQFQTEARIVRLHEEYEGQYVYGIQFVNLDNRVMVEIDETINYDYFPEDACIGF